MFDSVQIQFFMRNSTYSISQAIANRRLINASRFHLFFLLGAACIMLFTGCGGEEKNGRQFGGRPGGGFGGAGQAAAIPVQVAEVKRGDISNFLLQTTTIEAVRNVDILAKVTGQVVKLVVEEGARVREGDLLAQLDEIQLKIDYMQAKVKLETDKSVYERSKNMYENDLIAEENYETARLQYESSKAMAEGAKLKLDYTSVRSPINGVVTLRHIELGQRISVNEALFQVADFNPLRAKIYVPEKDMARVFEGQAAKITIESQPDQKFDGVVKMISPIVDPASGTVKVTIDIDKHENKLKPGNFVSVFITTETHENTLIIPKKALILESESDQVYVNRDGKASKVSLQTGFVSGEFVEVISGLLEGDQVVTLGQEGLREGLPIKTADEVRSALAAADSGRKAMAATENPGRGGNGGGQWGRGGDGPPDPERLKRMEARLMQNPEVKKEYEKRLKDDPSLKDDPEKKMAFFREMFRKMRGQQ